MNSYETRYLEARIDRRMAKGLIERFAAEELARKIDAQAEAAGITLDVIELDEMARSYVAEAL